LGCSQAPQTVSAPTDPYVSAPPAVTPPEPAPAPAPLAPAPKANEFGAASFTTWMAPQWYSYKISGEAFRLEWQLPDGTWREAPTYVEHLGVGYVGYMTEARPSVTYRLPVGRYRVTYGPAPCTYAYYYADPWREEFTVSADREASLSTTIRWGQQTCE
ncbi:MAG: hypothetical protein SFU83_11580, partial [Meiothermus sp.]|nr:hypothetical protein [Meiothermus sp.]